MSVLERTVSAIERTHADLATLNPNFLLFIALFFCRPYVGRHYFEQKHDFLSFLSRCFVFHCKFKCFMILIQFIIVFVIMRG